MWELLSQLNALTVFLAIGAVGLLFLLVSFVFGEVFGQLDFDHDVDHDLGDGGPGLFSLKVLSVFVTAFGGFGAIGLTQGLGLWLSSFLGLAGGVVLAGVVYFFARLLYAQQASSLVSADDLIGCRAEVVVGIPAGGFGQVRCLVGESRVDKIARSRDGGAIPQQAAVMIEEVAGESVVVSLWSDHDGYRLFSHSGAEGSDMNSRSLREQAKE
jgi:hypothetical protein